MQPISICRIFVVLKGTKDPISLLKRKRLVKRLNS